MFSSLIQFVRQAPSRMMGIGMICIWVSCFVLIPIAIALDDQRTVNEIESLPMAGVAVAVFLLGMLIIIVGDQKISKAEEM